MKERKKKKSGSREEWNGREVVVVGREGSKQDC